MSASPGLQPHLMTMVARLLVAVLSNASTSVVSKYGKVSIRKINALIWFRQKEKLNGR